MQASEKDRVRAGAHLALGWRSVQEMARVRPLAFWVSVLLKLVVALLPGLQVWTVRALTDRIAGNSSTTVILVLVVAIAVVVGLQTCAEAVSWLFARVTIAEHKAWLRTELNRSFARMTPAEIADAELASAGKVAREAIGEYGGFYARNALAVIQGFIGLVGLFLALWPISPWSAILLIASLVVVVPLLDRVSRLESRIYPRIIENNRYANYFADQITYQRTAAELVSLGSAERVVEMADRRYQQAVKESRSLYYRSTTWQLASGLTSALLAGLAVWFAARSSGGVGGAAAGVVAVLSGAVQASSTAEALGTYMSSTPVVRSAYQFIDARRHRKDRHVAAMEVAQLRANSVSYTYPGASRAALDDASIEARRGEMIALVGLNGAGKTTLVNVLAGLYEPTSGAIFLDSAPLRSLTDAERLGAVSVLTQEFGRYEFSVREAVMLGSPSGTVSDDEIWAALRLARADRFVRELPDGLDAQLGQQWGGTGLSGGQWQRLALARIALRGAPIWLLDEPTSAVDAVTEAAIFSDLALTKEERITVIVSHRAWTLRSMDRIYVLADGRIVECGKYDELLRAGGAFADMFSLQAGTEADG